MKRVSLVLFIIFAFLITGARFAAAQSLLIREITPESLLGTKAPDISGDLLGGGKFNLADYRGKNIVILDFWATWCGPCRMSLPILVKASQDYKEKGVVFFGINEGENPEQIRSFLKETTLSFNIILDPNGKIGSFYGADSLPTTIIVNKAGIIEVAERGVTREYEDNLKEQLDTLVAGKSLLTPDVPAAPAQAPQNPPPTAPAAPAASQPPVKAESAPSQPLPKAETLPEPTITPDPPISKPENPSPPQTETTAPKTFPLSPGQVKSVNILSPQYIIAALLIIGFIWAVINGLRRAGKEKSDTGKKED